jgi:CHAD domain-containing protein
MLAQLTVLHAESAGAEAGADLECIHRMRVASRRLRAVLMYFNQILPRSVRQQFEEQARGITQALGSSRDLDIQLQAVRRFQLMREPGTGINGLEELQARLETQRQQSGEEVRALTHLFQESPAVARVEEYLTELAAQPDTPPSTPLRLLAGQAVHSRLTKLLSFTEVMRDPTQIEQLHAMRIAAKRLRYTLEIFTALDAGGFKPWLKRVRGAQETLGAIHDCDVWEALLSPHANAGRGLPAGIQLWRENRANQRARLFADFIRGWDAPAPGSGWEELQLQLQKSQPAESTRQAALYKSEAAQGAAK